MILDAVGGREDVGAVDEGAAADEDVVELLLLQNGNLPWVLSCKYGRKFLLLKTIERY